MRKNTIENLKRQIFMIKWYFSDSQINTIGFLVLKTWWMHFWNLIFMVISDFYENFQIFMAQQHELFFFWKFGENADCVNPSLQALRAETMVDGLPRANRWLVETVMQKRSFHLLGE